MRITIAIADETHARLKVRTKFVHKYANIYICAQVLIFPMPFIAR